MHARTRSVDVTTSLSVVTASKKFMFKIVHERGVTVTDDMSSTEEVPRVLHTAGSFTNVRTRETRELGSFFLT